MRIGLVAFAVGVALLQVQGRLPETGLLAGLAALAAGLLWAARGGRLALLAAPGAALLGFAWAGLLAQQRIDDRLPAAWEAREITLTGVVASLPQRFERGERFAFDVETVHTAQARVPSRILLAWYHGWEEADDAEEAERGAAPQAARALHPGERWRLTVRLKRPHGNANPHGFDYPAWLLERNIRATGSVRGQGERVDDFVARPGYAVERLRDAIRGRFLADLPEAPYLGILMALAVGDQRAIPSGDY